MKITQVKNRKKAILLSLVGFVVLATAGVFYYLQTKKPAPSQSATPTINLSTPTSEELKAGEQIKKATIDKSTKSNDTNTPSDTPSADTPIAVSLHGMQSGEQINFDTTIATIANDGQCVLTLTSGGKTVTKSAGIFANPSSSSCKGFAVETSELSQGLWTANLKVVVNSRSGQATTTVEVQ